MKPERRVFLRTQPNWVIWLGVSGMAAFSLHYSVPTRESLGPAHDLVAGIAGIGMLVGFPIYAVQWLRVRSSRKPTQDDRNRFAGALIPYLAGGEAEQQLYALYIRPFFADDQIKLAFYSSTDTQQWRYGWKLDFEQVLADGVDRFVTVVTLGGPDGYGPGVVRVTNDSWQDAFRLLARRAYIIFVLPFAQSATEWEIVQLRAMRLLGKTVFIVPPHRKLKSAKFALSVGEKRSKEIFALSRERFAAAGLAVPEISRRGGLFTLNEDGSLRAKIEQTWLDNFGPDNLRESINALLKTPLPERKGRKHGA